MIFVRLVKCDVSLLKLKLFVVHIYNNFALININKLPEIMLFAYVLVVVFVFKLMYCYNLVYHKGLL